MEGTLSPEPNSERRISSFINPAVPKPLISPNI